MTEPRKFKAKELEGYNGKNGKSAYIAYQGKVYDASDSSLWRDGKHMGLHEAGKDISEEMELAPHGKEVLERMKLVGELV